MLGLDKRESATHFRELLVGAEADGDGGPHASAVLTPAAALATLAALAALAGATLAAAEPTWVPKQGGRTE